MNRVVRIHALEAKYELLKALRLPAYSLPTILFPILFYTFFGVVFGGRSLGDVNMATYLVATYGTFGMIGAALFGFGVTVAIERGQGWMQVKRTTPMPISAYFVAKIFMAMVFTTIITLLLFAMGTLFGNVHLTFGQGAGLLGLLIAGAIPFCAMGLAIGYFAGPSSATPIVNVIYLPMGFLSGLWIPIVVLPKAIQQIAFFLPPFHLSQLALRITGGAGQGAIWVHALALLIATAAFLAIAYAGYRRDEGKTYG